MNDVRASSRLEPFRDTSAEAERQRFAAIRKAAPTERLRQALDLNPHRPRIGGGDARSAAHGGPAGRAAPVSAAGLLRVVGGALDAAGMPFMLTGSLAAAYHGAGRATYAETRSSLGSRRWKSAGFVVASRAPTRMALAAIMQSMKVPRRRPERLNAAAATWASS